MNSPKKGILIIFEGIDGTGKSTQARLLYEALQAGGLEVILTREPTHGPFGQKIRQIAHQGRAGVSVEEEHQLFLEDRKEHVKNLLGPALESGKIVISDRYYFSNMAYQGALGLSPQKIKEDNEKIAPHPDIIFLLEIEPPEGINRIRVFRNDTISVGYEQEEYLWKVKKTFDNIDDPALVRLDAGLGVEELHRAIMEILKQRLGIQ